MRTVVVVTSVVVASLVAARTEAQDYTFVPVPGGAVADIAYDEHDAKVVFAAAHGVGIYKSTDGGISFAPRELPELRPHTPRQVLSSRAEAGVVLVCEPNMSGTPSDASNVFRSEDGGETFAAVLSMGGKGCTALAESGTEGTYYAATGTTPSLVLHRSTDGGKTWSPTKLTLSSSISLSSGNAVSSLLELPTGRLVFALQSGAPTFELPSTGSVCYSDDGSTLNKVTNIMGATDISGPVPDLAYNGTDTLRLFEEQVGDPYLFQSSDGASFEHLTFADATDSYSPYYELRYVPSRDAFLSLSGGRVLQSTDAAGGYDFDGFMPISATGHDQITQLTTVVADPSRDDIWLTGQETGGLGVVRIDDSGDRAIAAKGIDAARLDAALYDATSGYQYLVSYAGRVFFAETGAASARLVFRGRFSESEPITAIAYDRADPKHIVLGTTYGTSIDREVRMLELADAVAAPTDANDGQHAAWTRAADPKASSNQEYVTALIVDGMTRYVAYANITANVGTGQYIYRSRDGGMTYEALPLVTDQGVWMVARDPSDAKVLYAGGGSYVIPSDPTTKGLFKSEDAGDTWAQVADPALQQQQPSRIAFDPDQPAHFWVASTGQGGHVFQTLDAGATFTDVTPTGGSGELSDIEYSSSLGRVLLGRESGAYTHDPAGTAGTWESWGDFYGWPLALYAGGRGIATSAGLYVADDLVGSVGEGEGGASSSSGGSGASGASGGSTSAAGGSSARAGAGPSAGGSTSATGGMAGGPGSGGRAAGASGDGNAAGTASHTEKSSTGDKSSGCSCGVAGHSKTATSVWLLALLGLVRRRRASRLS